MKNMFLPLVCFLVLLVACATGKKTNHVIPAEFSKNTSGEEHCYKGFISEMSSFVPADAYYCGIFGNPNNNSSVQCAKKALKSGMPFIIGYQNFGYDSRYCRGVAKQANGQLLNIYYDSGMVHIPADSGSSAGSFEISRCKTIKLNPDKRGNPYFDADECVVAEDLADQIIKMRNH